MKYKILLVSLILILGVGLFFVKITSAAGVYIVNSTEDNPDINIGDGVCQTVTGMCSLRAAIQESNVHLGADDINFNIPGTGIQTVKLLSALPFLSDRSGPVTIDGYTQPGSVVNSSSIASDAKIMIQIEGGGHDKYDAFTITSSSNTIKGLAIYKFVNAFKLNSSVSDFNKITGNFIGTNASATYAAPLLPGSHGINFSSGASGNQIGGTNPAEKNVISGNAYNGIVFYNPGTNDNVIIGNLIGLNPQGYIGIPNERMGIDINVGASNNRIGGMNPGEANVISGNNGAGIEISHEATTQGNKIIGNYIGTDATGNGASTYTVNWEWGIHIEDRVANNIIDGNIISNNDNGGIEIEGPTTTNNIITNNKIGVSKNGNPMPNNAYGIRVNSPSNKIGPGNIIANNRGAGVTIDGSVNDFNSITQNQIFNNIGLGIDLDPQGSVNLNDYSDADTGPNEQLNFPVIYYSSPRTIAGLACVGCIVEVFKADSVNTQYGEGKTYLGFGVADSTGKWVVSVSGLVIGDVVTTTATDSFGNTSEFSLNRKVN